MVLIVATALSLLSFAFGATSAEVTAGQTGTVIITVASYPPVVDGLRIGANNVTEVNVETVYSWAIMVGDESSMKYLESVTIYLREANGTNDGFDEQGSYGFRWLRGDVWQQLTVKGWSNTTTYLNPAQSNHTQISPTLGQGEWRFAAKLPEKALYSGNSDRWLFEAVVRDRAGAESQKSIMFDVNFDLLPVQEREMQPNATFTVRG